MLDKRKKEELTSRQIEVLNLLRRGLTNGEICRVLNISENTVKVHLAKIYKILDVTNRTEAVSADLSENISRKNLSSLQDNDITVTVEMSDELNRFPLVYSVACAVIEALHQHHLFKIKILQAGCSNESSDYRLKLSAPNGPTESLFTTLYQGSSSSLLWSNLQKIESQDQVKSIACRNGIQLLRSMIVSGAERYSSEPALQTHWWYASCFTNIKMESRNKALFEKCQSNLQTVIDANRDNVYLVYTLVSLYYTAIVENWVNPEEYTGKIGQFACSAMRDNPYSSYSQFMMALYNILIGNKSDAIAYFQQILNANPQDYMARRYLTQIYMLVGREDDALKMLEENSLYVHESDQQPFQFIAKPFIYLLQGRYDECEELSKQVLMIYPETPLARLFMVVICNKKGNTTESQKHIQKFKEYHPEFTKNDLFRLLNGVAENKKDDLINALGDIF